jgi:UrcA family protein
MKSFTLVATALVLSGSIFSVATAAPRSDVPTAVVRFGDLDVTREAGKEALYRRLAGAARTVCLPLDAGEPWARVRAAAGHSACVNQAVFGAVAKINLPDFADYVAARLAKPADTTIQLAAR